MSWHISTSTLVAGDGAREHWQKTYGPSDTVPVSGIYRCTGCKREITSNAGDPFPAQNKHQHSSSQGAIRWKLNVRTNTDGD